MAHSILDEVVAIGERARALIDGYAAVACRVLQAVGDRDSSVLDGGASANPDASGDTIGPATELTAPQVSTALVTKALSATPGEPAGEPVDANAAPAVAPENGATSATVPDSPSSTCNELPIVDYDLLAASQVVQRLANLRQDELDTIRQHETTHRGRRTILHKIDQLTTAEPVS